MKKTAIKEAIKEIADLWSSPSDTPTYTKIFEILERKLPMEKQQIFEAFKDGVTGDSGAIDSVQYYKETYEQ